MASRYATADSFEGCGKARRASVNKSISASSAGSRAILSFSLLPHAVPPSPGHRMERPLNPFALHGSECLPVHAIRGYFHNPENIHTPFSLPCQAWHFRDRFSLQSAKEPVPCQGQNSRRGKHLRRNRKGEFDPFASGRITRENRLRTGSSHFPRIPGIADGYKGSRFFPRFLSP